MFVDFAIVQQTSRKKIPFGIAQIGKSFPQRGSTGNFIFRTREFEQMEMEFFVGGTDDEWFGIGCTSGCSGTSTSASTRAPSPAANPTDSPALPRRRPPTSSTSSRSAGRRSRGSRTGPTST